jgi:hypothetical protein
VTLLAHRRAYLDAHADLLDGQCPVGGRQRVLPSQVVTSTTGRGKATSSVRPEGRGAVSLGILAGICGAP